MQEDALNVVYKKLLKVKELEKQIEAIRKKIIVAEGDIYTLERDKSDIETKIYDTKCLSANYRFELEPLMEELSKLLV